MKRNINRKEIIARGIAVIVAIVCLIIVVKPSQKSGDVRVKVFYNEMADSVYEVSQYNPPGFFSSIFFRPLCWEYVGQVGSWKEAQFLIENARKHKIAADKSEMRYLKQVLLH